MAEPEQEESGKKVPKKREPETKPNPEIAQIVAEIETNLAGKLKTAVEDVEIKLGQKLEQEITTLGKSLQPLVEAAITANLPQIVNQVGAQFKEKIENAPGSAAAGAGETASLGLSLSKFLDKASVKDVVDAYATFKQPSSDQQLASVFKTFIQGMNFGQKIKSGDLSPKDMEDALSLTIGEKKE